MQGGTAAVDSKKMCGSSLDLNFDRAKTTKKYPMPMADIGTP
jgi:hypothetical protein